MKNEIELIEYSKEPFGRIGVGQSFPLTPLHITGVAEMPGVGSFRYDFQFDEEFTANLRAVLARQAKMARDRQDLPIPKYNESIDCWDATCIYHVPPYHCAEGHIVIRFTADKDGVITARCQNREEK